MTTAYTPPALTDTQRANRKLFDEGKIIPGFTNLFSSKFVPTNEPGKPVSGYKENTYNTKKVAEKAYELFGYETYDPDKGISYLSPETTKYLQENIKDNPASPRYQYYLASTLRDLQNNTDGAAILAVRPGTSDGMEYGIQYDTYYSKTPAYQPASYYINWATNPNNPGSKYNNNNTLPTGSYGGGGAYAAGMAERQRQIDNGTFREIGYDSKGNYVGMGSVGQYGQSIGPSTKNEWSDTFNFVVGVAALSIGLPYVIEAAGAVGKAITLAAEEILAAGGTITEATSAAANAGALATGVDATVAASLGANAAANITATGLATASAADLAAITGAEFLATSGAVTASSVALSAPTLSMAVLNPGLALGSAISAGTGVAMSPIAATALGNVIIQTATNGGDVGKAVESAVRSYALDFAGQEISQYVGDGLKEIPGFKDNPNLIKTATTGLSNAAIDLAQGKNPLPSLAGAGLGFVSDSLVNQIPGIGNYSKEAKQVAGAAITAQLNGKNPSKAAFDAALRVGAARLVDYVDRETGASDAIKSAANSLRNDASKLVSDVSTMVSDTATSVKDSIKQGYKTLVGRDASNDELNAAQTTIMAGGKVEDTLTTLGNSTEARTYDQAHTDVSEATAMWTEIHGKPPTAGQLADYLDKPESEVKTLLTDNRNTATATNAGFPDYAKYQEFGGNLSNYTAALDVADKASTDLTEATAAFKKVYGRDPTKAEEDTFTNYAALPESQVMAMLATNDAAVTEVNEAKDLWKSVFGTEPTAKQLATYLGKPELDVKTALQAPVDKALTDILTEELGRPPKPTELANARAEVASGKDLMEVIAGIDSDYTNKSEAASLFKNQYGYDPSAKQLSTFKTYIDKPEDVVASIFESQDKATTDLTEAAEIFESVWNRKPRDKELANFTGMSEEEVRNKFFADVAAWKPEDTSMAGGEQTAALEKDQVTATDAGTAPTRYVPIQSVDANNKNAIAASDALSAAIARDGAQKNATFSPVYYMGENGYRSYVTSSNIDGNPTGYTMTYYPDGGEIIYSWSGGDGEQIVDENGNPVLSTVYINASRKPPKFDSTTGTFINSSGQPVQATAQTPSEPMPTGEEDTTTGGEDATTGDQEIEDVLTDAGLVSDESEDTTKDTTEDTTKDTTKDTTEDPTKDKEIEDVLTDAGLVQIFTRDLTSIITKDVASLTTKDVPVITTKDVASITTKDISNLTTKDIVGLLTKDISSITTKDIAGISTKDIASITTKDIASISTKDIIGLVTKDIAGITTKDIAGITTKDIAGISTKDIAGLGTKDIAGISTKDISGLGTKDISGLGTKDISGLGTENIAGLGTKDISGLGTGDLAGLGTKDLVGLGTKDIAGLETEDVSLIDLEEATDLPDNTVTEVIADAAGGEGGGGGGGGGRGDGGRGPRQPPVRPPVKPLVEPPVRPPVQPPAEQLYQTTTQGQPTTLADIQYYLDMTGTDILPSKNKQDPVESLLNQSSQPTSIEELLRYLRS